MSNISNKTILEEDDYINVLGSIIEKNYFPETSKLKTHLELLDVLDSNIPRSVKQKLVNNYYNTLNEEKSYTNDVNVNGKNVTIDTNQMTLNDFFKNYTSEDNASFESIHQEDQIQHRKKYHWAYESIIDGQNTDEASLSAYKSGMLMLYYFGNKHITPSERVKMDAILNGEKSIEYQEPNQVDTWKFRVRNSLMFPPTLEENEDVCGVTEQKQVIHTVNDMTKKITPSFSSSSSTSITVPNQNRLMDTSMDTSMGTMTNPLPLHAILSSQSSSSSSADDGTKLLTDLNTYNTRISAPTLSEKEIIPRNTALSSKDIQIDSLFSEPQPLHRRTHRLPIEPPHTPSILSDTISNTEGSVVSREKEYTLVNMTPLIIPGEGYHMNEMKPSMTYGTIFAMPILLDPSPPPSPPSSSLSLLSSLYTRHENTRLPSQHTSPIQSDTSYRYEMLSERPRDILARQLEMKHKHKSRRHSTGNTSSSSSSLLPTSQAVASIYGHTTTTTTTNKSIHPHADDQSISYYSTKSSSSSKRSHQTARSLRSTVDKLTPAGKALAYKLAHSNTPSHSTTDLIVNHNNSDEDVKPFGGSFHMDPNHTSHRRRST